MDLSIKKTRKVASPIVVRHIVGILLAVLAWCGTAQPEVCPGSKVKIADLKRFDQHLVLPQSEINAAIAKHLPWGAPECAKLLVLREFVVCYDVQRRIPLWAAYQLTSAEIIQKERRDAFRTDPRLTDAENAHCADYRGTGYDRGHSVPRDDMNRTFEVQADTFLLSNMSPQTPALNRGIWRWLEDLGRVWGKEFNTVYVIMGPVFVGLHSRTLPSGRVAIPTEFFKMVIRRDQNGDLQAETFLLTNGSLLPVPPGTMGVPGQPLTAQQADDYLLQHSTSIGFIEQLTGLKFFPDLPIAQRQTLESSAPRALWPRN
jgi:endonuclease G